MNFQTVEIIVTDGIRETQQLDMLIYSKLETIEAGRYTFLLKDHVKYVHW